MPLLYFCTTLKFVEIYCEHRFVAAWFCLNIFIETIEPFSIVHLQYRHFSLSLVRGLPAIATP